MKAIRIHERGGLDVMKLEEVEVPTPGPNEVLIKVAAAGVNYSDVGQRRGDYPNLVPLPTTLGDEVAGIVVGRGVEVTSPAEGARVVALVKGGYAEYAVAPAARTISIPDAVSFAQATVVPIQGQTAYLVLDKAARLQPGERVLVHAAAGGVGTLAVQLARLLGASMVIGSSRSPEKLAYIRELGADLAVNTNDPNWVGQVMQATGGQGVDIILDAVGGSLTQPNLACLAPFGRMVVFGALSSSPPANSAQGAPPANSPLGGASFGPPPGMSPAGPPQGMPPAGQAMGGLPLVPPPMLIPKCLTVSGYNTLIQPLADQLRASHALLDYIVAGKVQVTLKYTYPLAEAAAAHQAIEAQQTSGKVVLTI